jgi:phage gp45-like
MMSRHRRLARITLLVLFAICALGAPVSAQPRTDITAAACTGSISGVVTAADTTTPFVSATVTATLIGGDFRQNADTAGDGSYSITGLPAGRYLVEFEPPSGQGDLYVNEYYNNQHDVSNAALVVVREGATTPGINAALERGGAISGTVTGVDTGLTISQVLVYVYNSAGDIVEITFTETAGTYRTKALPSGSYKVRFDPSGSNDRYLAEFYNNKVDLASASPVAVTAPNDTANINAVLDVGGQIKGVVTAAVGAAPLENVRVSFYTLAGQFVDDVSTDSSGAYESHALRTGSYKVRFDPSESDTPGVSAYLEEYNNNRLTLAAADAVTVTAPNPTTVNAALDKGGQFVGKVTAADTAQPLEGVDVDVFNSAGVQIGTSETDSQGNYATQGLRPGSYKLRFDPDGSDAEDSYVFEYHNNKLTLAAADAVAAPAPGTTTPVNAALDPGGRISGTVTLAGTDVCGGPIDNDNAQVSIYDAGGQLVAIEFTSSDGTYTTAALRPGSYRVRFDGPFGTSFITVFYNGKPSLATANAVAVTAGALTPNINATLLPARKVFVPLVAK